MELASAACGHDGRVEEKLERSRLERVKRVRFSGKCLSISGAATVWQVTLEAGQL